MSFSVSCFASLVLKILKNPINCRRPKDLMFIPDEASARPPAQTNALEIGHQLTCRRTRIYMQERGLGVFTARAEFICGQRIMWACPQDPRP